MPPAAGPSIAARHLAGFTGVLQVDGYIAYDKLTEPSRVGGPLTLAFCWAHAWQRFYDIAKGGNAPIASEALERIGALYAIEADICGQSASACRDQRVARTKPLLDALKSWLEAQLARVSGRSPAAQSIRYCLSH
jgi:transposase